MNLNRKGIHSDSRIGESVGSDSPIEVVGMPKSYSADLRQRVVEVVASGASRHEAAELFGIAVSTVIKWWQQWRDTRSVEPKPRGGSTSPLDEHTTLILGLVNEKPDSTFMELLAALRKRRIRTSRSALWRFFERHNITFKKNSLQAAERQREDVARARRRWIRNQGLLDPAHLVFIEMPCGWPNCWRAV
jgi:transposase